MQCEKKRRNYFKEKKCCLVETSSDLTHLPFVQSGSASFDWLLPSSVSSHWFVPSSCQPSFSSLLPCLNHQRLQLVVVVASVEVEHRLVGVEAIDFPISDWDIPSNLGCTCWRTNHGCIAAEVVYYCHRCLQHMPEVVHCLMSLSLLT